MNMAVRLISGVAAVLPLLLLMAREAGLGLSGELHWYDRVRLWPLTTGVVMSVLCSGAVCGRIDRG